MNKDFSSTNLGDISINNEVIKNIALKAATDIPGIHQIKESCLKKILGVVRKKDRASGVRLEFTDSSELKIILKLTVDYGVNIPDAAAVLQENVKKVVEGMIGLIVTEVTVRIVGIKRPAASGTKEELRKESEG